jgi:hypothetical protein
MPALEWSQVGPGPEHGVVGPLHQARLSQTTGARPKHPSGEKYCSKGG